MHARPDGPLAAAINRKIKEAPVWLSRHAAIGRCPGGQNASRSPFSPRPAPQMDDQRGQGHQDKTGEPPLIERVAAQMPVERVIDRMNCPSDDEANERDADAVRPHQREQHADADADLEGADVM
jgi:hypothetical protein